MSDLRERLVAALLAGRRGFEQATEDGVEVDWLASAALGTVAEWLEQRAGTLSNGGWHAEATLLAEERIGTYQEIARLLRTAEQP